MIQNPLPIHLELQPLSSNPSFSIFSNYSTLAIVDKNQCGCPCIPDHYQLTAMKDQEPDYSNPIFDIKQTKLCCAPTYQLSETISSRALAEMELKTGFSFCCASKMSIKDHQNQYLGSSVFPAFQLCDPGVWVNNSNEEHRYWIGSKCVCVCCETKKCCNCCSLICRCFSCNLCPIKYFSVPILEGTKTQVISNLDLAKTWLKYTFGCCGKFFMILNYPPGANEIDKVNTTTGAIMYYKFVGQQLEKK